MATRVMAMKELEIARGLREEIEAAGQQADLDCHVSGDMIQKLSRQGLFATMIAEAYGGTQRPPMDTLDLIEELSYADSAVGWTGMIYHTTALLGSFLPERWAREIFGVNREGDGFDCPIAAGAAAPSGKGEVVEGGIVVSGRWAWGSGTHNADWVAGGTIVSDNGEVRSFENGAPAVHVMFFEKDHVLLHENWDPSGLRGTGSGDFEVKDYFVPDGRWTVLGASRRQIDAPLYRFPFFGFFATAVASVPLGIARRAVHEFEAMSRAKGSGGRTASLIQVEFGQAEALVQAAQYLIRGTVTDVWERIVKGEKVELEEKRRLRLAASQATALCSEAVDRLYNAGGGTSLQGHCRLQKQFRDIHAATQHRMVSREVLRMAAGVKLDGESTAQL
ncbi:MAG: acyl-CoA dehydrogenase family protein [Pseudomonadota bacterium]